MHVSALLSTALLLATPPVATRHHCTKHPTGFAADPSINAHGILEAAKAAKGDPLATFPPGQGRPDNVEIFGDWLNLSGVSAMHFIADMDVDCDGVDYKCPHNPDGQPQTSFGHLSATCVPFYVIPEHFYDAQSSFIQPNSLGAIICNGKMFYAIFGDTDGDTPEVIGEASILVAQTCFPDEHLDGGNGHSELDVLYVIFGSDVPQGVGDVTIDIGALKTLGDQQAQKLAEVLGV